MAGLPSRKNNDTQPHRFPGGTEEIMSSGTVIVNNGIYLRRRGRIVPPEGSAGGSHPLPPQYVASLARNVEALGYALSPALAEAFRALPLPELTALYESLIAELRRLRGADRPFEPMYPGFPDQVMRIDEGELYLNALLHYWTDGRYMPPAGDAERSPLLDETEYTPIDLGSREDFETLFAQVAGANTSLSEQDRDDLAWFAAAYGDGIGPMLPASVPQKENAAYLAGLLMAHANRERAVDFVGVFCRTATDLLRLAVALSDGDLSLAAPTKFRTFSRAERALLLALLDRAPNATEDMLRWKGRWVRLGEKLHPGEHAMRYPEAARAFQILRNDEPFATFNGQVEKALGRKDVAAAVVRLATRPGDLARRLDHLLRLDDDSASRERVLSAFAEAAPRVSTPVLLQVRHHFATRRERRASLRVFLPKGSVAKAQGIANRLPELPSGVCESTVSACERALTERFSALPPLGKVYVDPALADYMVPFALRSASKSLRTLVRGSRLPLPPACRVLRFFVWWKNGRERTDIDLSAAMFDAAFNYVDLLAYYNLKGFGGVHSGDIVDAPEGASEFIDVSLEKVREKGVRYVVMSLTSYTRQPYIELPECFAGWMARQKAGSGEVFEPRTVQDRLDVTADTQIAIPLVVDVQEGRVVWCDMALRRDPTWQNNVHGNLTGIQLTLRSLVEMRRPNLYDLFALHARARGERVSSADEADAVFSVADGTPFRLEEIAARYLA